MKQKIKAVWIIFMSIILLANSQLVAQEKMGSIKNDYEWWCDARFGIFIHWNMSSILVVKGGSWHSINRLIDTNSKFSG